MKTQRVSALELLKHPLPIIVKGVRGLYEITKVVAEGSRITCYRTGEQGAEIATLRKPFYAYFDVIVTESNPDKLLDAIGSLYARNKSLQKGHATLTRRVQELEEQLKSRKHSGTISIDSNGMRFTDTNGNCRVSIGSSAAALSDTAIKKILVDVMAPEIAVTDTKLKAETDTDTEALTQRVAALELVLTPGYLKKESLSDLEVKRIEDFNKAMDQKIKEMMRPGGLLYGSLK